MIRCNNCDTEYQDEFELKLIEKDGEYIDACAICEDDQYLMDL